MKTKVDKKGKKRPLTMSETSLSTKPTQKQEDVIESKKNPKKIKLATSVQNGNSTTQNKVQILKKMYKQKEKPKMKQINIGPLKTMIKTEKTKLPIAKLKEESVSKKTKTKENKLENLKKKFAKREVHKKKRKRFVNAASITLSLEEIEAKIEEIRGREVLSKRAKKILTVLNRKLKYEKANKSEKLNITGKKSNKKNKDQINALMKIKQESNEDNEEKIQVKKEHVQHKVKSELEMDDQDDSDDQVDSEDQDDDENDEDESDEDHSVIKTEESMDNVNEKCNALMMAVNFDDESDEDDEESEDEESEDDEESKDDEESEDDEEPEDDESEDDDDIDEKANILKGKQEDVKKIKNQALEHQKKNQYVLFVKNLPSKVTDKELKQHFLTKVDTVANVKIPVKPSTKIPYGFAFVELTNSIDFEKGLSMNHSLFKKQRINVEVAIPNDKKINIVKNFAVGKNKLQELKEVEKNNLSRNQQKKKFKKEK